MNTTLVLQAMLALATALVIGSLFYVTYQQAIKPDFNAWLADRRARQALT